MALAAAEAQKQIGDYSNRNDYFNTDLMPFLHIKLGQVLEEQDKLQESAKSFLTALKLIVDYRGAMSPYVIGTGRQLAHVYMLQGDLDCALRDDLLFNFLRVRVLLLLPAASGVLARCHQVATEARKDEV